MQEKKSKIGGLQTGTYLQKVDTVLNRFKVSDQCLSRTVKHSSDVARLFNWVSESDVEKCIAVFLNCKNEIVHFSVTSVGTNIGAQVNPRDILKVVLLTSTYSVIMVHNHPSGDPTPSAEDERITHAVDETLKLIEAKLLDHVILGQEGSYYSFADKGKINP